MPVSTREKEIARFDPALPLAGAQTPPASWYTDERVFEREKKTVFRSTWQAVGRRDQVVSTGDYFTGYFLGEPYVVVRAADGKVRAFYNVCRHHATCVAQGCGRARKLTCPYHGWTYNLDGSLFSAPRAGKMTDFDASAFGLKPIALESWGPLIFIHFGENPVSLAEELGDLGGDLEARGFSDLTFAARRTYEMRCNWKVYVDNYLDGGYHVSLLHKALGSQLNLKSYRTEIFGRYCVQSCEGKLGTRVAGRALYAWAYPNFMINRYGRMMDTNWVVPLAVDRTLVVFDYYFEEAGVPSGGIDELLASALPASDRVQKEDIDICESVQRGLASSAYDTGRYAPDWEKGAHHFHRLLAEDLS